MASVHCDVKGIVEVITISHSVVSSNAKATTAKLTQYVPPHCLCSLGVVVLMWCGGTDIGDRLLQSVTWGAGPGLWLIDF